MRVNEIEVLQDTVAVLRSRRLRGLRHGADGVTTVMIGRDDELQRLQQLAAAVFALGGGLGAATAIGDAGPGKSLPLAEGLVFQTHGGVDESG